MFLGAITVVVAFLATQINPLDGSALLLIGIVAFAFVLYALNPIMAASDLGHARNALFGIQGLTVVKKAGFYAPRLQCLVAGAGSQHTPLTIRFSCGWASDMMAESASFSLKIQWGAVADVMVSRARSYSDFPGLLDELESVRQTLSPGEYLWSDLSKRRLESLVNPGWGRWRKANESPDELRERILGRWRKMDALRAKAESGDVFRPLLTRHAGEGRGFPGPFTLGAWCRSCQRPQTIWSVNSLKACRRCGGILIEVLYRGDLSEKMRAVGKVSLT